MATSHAPVQSIDTRYDVHMKRRQRGQQRSAGNVWNLHLHLCFDVELLSEHHRRPRSGAPASPRSAGVHMLTTQMKGES